jgi:hypothetical protein
MNIETRSTDIMVRRDPRPSPVLENESGANDTVNQHLPHDLHISPRIYDILPLGASSFTMQQPLHVPYPTPFMAVVSNTSTRVGEDIIQGVVEPTKEALGVISPSQLHGRMDWRRPHEVGATPAAIRITGTTSSTLSIIPTIPPESLSSSATTLLPSTEGSSNGSHHGIIRYSSHQGSIQELNPCAEYVAPGKGPMSGGIEVTIVGIDFPHTLPLRVYFSTKPALVVGWKHLALG